MIFKSNGVIINTRGNILVYIEHNNRRDSDPGRLRPRPSGEPFDVTPRQSYVYRNSVMFAQQYGNPV